MSEKNIVKEMPKLPKEVVEHQINLLQEQIDLIEREKQINKEIQEIKESNLDIIDGKVKYFTMPEYIKLVTDRERLLFEANVLKADEELKTLRAKQDYFSKLEVVEGDEQ